MHKSNDVLHSDILMAEARPCESSAISENEELSRFVTLQIALVGMDGWVLASDLHVQEPFRLENEGNRYAAAGSSASKIVNWKQKDLLYTFAGGAFAQEVGIALRDMPNLDEANRRDEFLLQAAISARDRMGQNVSVNGGLLVIFQQPDTELWTFDLTNNQRLKKLDWGWTGGGNLALLFPQLYYKPLPIEQLKLLAAHTILLGAQCNRGSVEGLEIWVGKDRGPATQIMGEELDDLIEKSNEVHGNFQKLICAGA